MQLYYPDLYAVVAAKPVPMLVDERQYANEQFSIDWAQRVAHCFHGAASVALRGTQRMRRDETNSRLQSCG